MAYKFLTKSKQNSTSSFYGKIPPELRNQIWIMSLPDPRIIVLEPNRQPSPNCARHGRIRAAISSISRRTTSASQTSVQRDIIIHESRDSSPNISTLCQESRAIFCHFYTFAFRNDISHGTWVDFKNDVLYLPPEIYQFNSDFYKVFEQDFKQVKILAVSGIWSSDPENPSRLHQLGTVSDINEILWKFGNLVDLVLVDAQHELGLTAGVRVVVDEGESAKEFEEWLIPWSHPIYNDNAYSWPSFQFVTFTDNLTPGHSLKDKLQTRGRKFITMVSARWTSNESTL